MSSEFFESLLSLRSKLVYADGVCGRWGIDHNSHTAIWFHLVTKGGGWLHYPSRAGPIPCQAGDVAVFLPHAEPHYFSYSADEVVFDYPDAKKTSFEASSTGFVCTVVERGLPRAQLWSALPGEILIPRTAAGSDIADLVRLTIDEAHAQRLGSYAVIERLCDSIFVLRVRHCIEHGRAGVTSLAAMQDRRIDTALNLIQREPWYPWTVGELSERASVSRTVLTEAFQRVPGCAPGEYLMCWRMQTADHLLRASTLPVKTIAERCGYASVSAFTRAFKKCHGVAPGSYRRLRSANATEDRA